MQKIALGDNIMGKLYRYNQINWNACIPHKYINTERWYCSSAMLCISLSKSFLYSQNMQIGRECQIFDVKTDADTILN